MDNGREKFHLVHPQCLRRLKVAADQGITQVGVAAVHAEYSRVIKQFLSFRVRF